ncbi:MAG: hypothetical protein U9N73_03715, partial [Candidatus Auribacterota bacterium]|nr:hypothetical protein [Candidatus Auribacterota bacterium]
MEGETKSENTFIKAWNQLAHAFAPYIIQELHLIKANVYCSSSHHFSAIGLICGNLDLYILKS